MSEAASQVPLRGGDVIFLVAGEPSGDALGARLMAALKKAAGDRIRFAGVGGERMAAEGLRSLFPLTDIAVMGLTEVLGRLPTVLRRLRQTAAEIRRVAPAAIVTIDAPSFTLRVADRVRDDGAPLIHYVAPQLWAWRPGRARKLARRVDRLLSILPFEPDFFRPLGVACDYVGHPSLEEALEPVSGEAFRVLHGIAAGALVLVVMPGSRDGLARRMIPVFLRAVELLADRVPGLHAVIPTLAGAAPIVRAQTAGWRVPHTIVTAPADRRGAFAAATAALTVSGTATLELAVAGTPMVAAYLVSRITEFIARRLIRVAHVSVPNLILGRAAVPEMLQDDCAPEKLATALHGLIAGPAAAAQRRDFEELRRIMGLEEMRATGITPSDRAAAIVLEVIRDRSRV